MKIRLLQRRGVLIARCASVVAFALSFVGLSMMYWLIRPLVWAAIYMVPYSSPKGPYDPNSGEWLFVQAIGFLCSVSAGLAAARWSRPNSPQVWISFALALLILTFMGHLPVTSPLRVVIFILGGPVGVICGAALYLRDKDNAAVALRGGGYESHNDS